MTMTEVSDQSEIMDQLDVSATASIKSIGGSASAQASFAKNSKTSATETTLLLKATVQNGVLFAGPEAPGCPARRAFPQIPENSPKSQETMPNSSGCQSGGEDLVDNIRFTTFAEKLAKDSKRLDEFHKMCGDAYVSRIYSGAELLATIGISTTGTEDQTSIAASVKAGFGGGQVGAEATTDETARRESANLSIHFAQVGGGGGLMPISREGLSGKLQSLTIEAARDPTFIGVEVTSYRSLTNGPKERSLRDREISADSYWFLLSLEQEISDILATPQDYDFTVGLTPHSLRELQDISIKIRENIRKLEYVANPVDLSPDTPSPVGLECNDHTINWVEPKTLPTLEELRKIADKKKNNHPPTAADLRENLRTVLPYCNPNVLRLYLPPPKGQLAVDTYIRPLAQRMCALDPSDNECLTNAQISALDRGLKPFTFLLQNVASGRCLGGDYKAGSPVCTDTQKAQQFDLFWDPVWKQHSEDIPSDTLGEYALVKRPAGKALQCLSRSKASKTIKYEVQNDKYWDTDHCGWHIRSDGRINSARKEYSPEGDSTLACLGMNKDKDDLWKMKPKSCEPTMEERDQIRWRMIPVPTM
ncbi:MAG: hypothetical protein NPIRA03_40440 [Nitrospirales bacterium]|nr:MAG: hypothetical protein NPIRA03_40440 [Nitrospirales bacterium]